MCSGIGVTRYIAKVYIEIKRVRYMSALFCLLSDRMVFYAADDDDDDDVGDGFGDDPDDDDVKATRDNWYKLVSATNTFAPARL